MKIFDVLDMMDNALDKALQVPLAGKRGLVDVNSMRDLVEELRLCLPGEINQAQRIITDRADIIAKANSEKAMIIKNAEDKAVHMLSKHEITRLAHKKAHEIMSDAQKHSREMRDSTNAHVENMLGETEMLLAAQLTEIKRAKNALRARK
ncbi:MAG: ATPase [Oscillospiraceae bacterium]|nr:ATPase [Oscillospiraceae bacterium]